MNEQVALKPGDYVATAGMDEATYHAVARAFTAAGCKGFPSDLGKDAKVIGWSSVFKRYGWDYQAGFSFHRELTPEQVINATNVGGATADLVAAVRTAKATLDDARAEYTKALDALREALGEGFVIVEAGGTIDPADGTLQTVTLSEDATLGGWQEWPGGQCPVDKGTLVDVRYRDGVEEFSLEALKPEQGRPSMRLAMNWKHNSMGTDIVAWRLADEPDMTDPANWRAGDVVECIKNYPDQFSIGNKYTLRVNCRGRRVHVISDDGGDTNGAGAHYFRFHHRPNT